MIKNTRPVPRPESTAAENLQGLTLRTDVSYGARGQSSRDSLYTMVGHALG